jgi:hypothetical protein
MYLLSQRIGKELPVQIKNEVLMYLFADIEEIRCEINWHGYC